LFSLVSIEESGNVLPRDGLLGGVSILSSGIVSMLSSDAFTGCEGNYFIREIREQRFRKKTMKDVRKKTFVSAEAAEWHNA
jgi:hypothetical protein